MKKLFIFASIILFGCSSLTIENVQHEDGFSLSKYKTFGFVNIDAQGDALGENYFANLELLKKAITKQFEKKGISFAASNPDMIVNIGIVVSKEVQTRETSITDPGAGNYYMGQRNYTWKSEEVVVRTYKQGSVTLDLVDREGGKLVWQGTATSMVPEKEKNVPSLIDEGMQKLFLKVK